MYFSRCPSIQPCSNRIESIGRARRNKAKERRRTAENETSFIDGIEEEEEEEEKDSEWFEKDESEGEKGKVEEKEKDEETHGERIEKRGGLVAEQFVEGRHRGEGQRARTETRLQLIDDEAFDLKGKDEGRRKVEGRARSVGEPRRTIGGERR